MSKWLSKLGIKKLSELIIDASKDWGGYLIKNLGAPVDSNDALRKTELDSHAADGSAHHTKTTSVAELTDHDLANHESLGIRKITFDIAANKPASGATTELFVETDTTIIYRGTGTGWEEIGRAQSSISGLGESQISFDIAAGHKHDGVSARQMSVGDLSNHNKSVHDALAVDADTLDTYHASQLKKLSAIATLVLSGASLLSANTTTTLVITTGNGKFLIHTAYFSTASETISIMGKATQASYASVYHAGANDTYYLELHNGTSTSYEITYKVYKFTE
jgi:hypothetical protein